MSERLCFLVMLDRVQKAIEVPMAADAAEPPLRLGDPGGDHRTIITPSRHRSTLRVKRPIRPFMFSIALVLRSVR